MFDHPIARLRLAGLLEGTSFLVLLGIAMPLKYLADTPVAVQVVGWIHGLLFVSFCLVLLNTKRHQRWPLARAVKFFVAALIPFGPFLVDRGLREEQRPESGDPSL